MQRIKPMLCKLHPDFHLPENVSVGEKFNGLDYAKKAKKTGADNLVHYAKDHYGHAYYPTKAGTIHPGLSFDMLKDFVEGCRKENISPSVDYSVFLDTAAVRSHPDWVLQETPVLSDEVFNSKYSPICVNSGYLEEMLIPQTIELVKGYDIDELFFDTMSDFTPCYCKRCTEKFGKPIPLDSSCADWPLYVKWYIRQYELFFERILQVVHELAPEISVVVNWRWSATLPTVPVKHVKRLVGDLFTSPSVASYFSRYWAGTGYPFDYMCGRFLHHLGDWSSNTPESLKAAAAATVANGGSFYIIDRQLPDGTLEERSYPLLTDVFSFVQQRRDVLENTVHVKETAVLHSLENIIGADAEFFPDRDEREKRLRPLKAVSRILVQGGRHYTALNTERLLEVLNDYKLLIIPEADFIDDLVLSHIRAFVEKGGRVIIVQSDNNTPVNKGLLELAGVEYNGQYDGHYCYIESSNNGVTNPILVRGRFTQVNEKKNTIAEASIISPWCEGTNVDFGHGFAPPSVTLEYKAVTRRKLGEGEVVYIAGPVLTSYFTHLNPDISNLFLNIYDSLLAKPIAKVVSNGHIEVVSMKKGADLIIHLINHSGKEFLADKWMPITEFIPEFENLCLLIHDNGNTDSITYEPQGILLDSTVEDDYKMVVIPKLHIMSTCRVKGYFKKEAEDNDKYPTA